ncbi:MAG: hypothetical protein ACM3Q1_18415 [Bacteroidales bacterium]
MNRTTALLLAALPVLVAPAFAGEIIIVDPYGGVTRGETQTTRDAKIDQQTGADRARSWSEGNHGRTSQGTILVVPQSSGNTVVLVPNESSGNAARDAVNRAGSYVRGDEDGVAADDVERSIIVIDNGQVRAGDDPPSETASRAHMSAAKARAYSQGSKPCGSVVVGGIGESGQHSPNTQAKDVYVVNTNCR